jgi:hypothetical protein
MLAEYSDNDRTKVEHLSRGNLAPKKASDPRIRPYVNQCTACAFYIGWIFDACLPLGPWSTSKQTFWCSWCRLHGATRPKWAHVSSKAGGYGTKARRASCHQRRQPPLMAVIENKYVRRFTVVSELLHGGRETS